MNDKKRIGLVVSLGVAVILVMTAFPVRATIYSQESHEWYGQGKTAVYGVYAGNTDADASTEIVTVGEVYTGPMTGTKAQMNIWGWNSQTSQFSVEKTKEWRNYGQTAVAVSVYVGDLDDDSANEMVTVGYGTNSGIYYNELVIWEYVPLTMDYTAVETLGYVSGRMFNSVYATQIFGSDALEIVVAGVDAGTPSEAILHMFTYEDDSISLDASADPWSPNDGDANAKGVYAEDVDGDSTVEILTAGYIHDIYDDLWAHVMVFSYSDGELEREDIDGYAWNAGYDEAEALSVFAADVGSGDIEIVTCGNVFDSGISSGDLEILTHSGSAIGYDRRATPWQYSSGEDTECPSVYVGDLDGTSPLDIVTGGKAVASGDVHGQIRVWNYGTYPDIDLVDTEEWRTYDDTEAHSVFVGNVDSDNPVEMVTGGEAYDGTRIRAQLRIWYWS